MRDGPIHTLSHPTPPHQSREPILRVSQDMLTEFYRPFNAKLATLLGDER